MSAPEDPSVTKLEGARPDQPAVVQEDLAVPNEEPVHALPAEADTGTSDHMLPAELARLVRERKARSAVRLRILMESGWAEAEVRPTADATLADALALAAGALSLPVAFVPRCADGRCGRCSVNVSGVATLACRTDLNALVGTPRSILRGLRRSVPTPILRITPLSKFRPAAGLETDHPGRSAYADRPLDAPQAVPSCIQCGICFEACPSATTVESFLGPAELHRLRLEYEQGAPERQAEALGAILSNRGVIACGDAQVCVEVCPEGLPLTESIRRLRKLGR